MYNPTLKTVYFPYALRKQPDGRWVVLNRYYRPVGINVAEPVELDKYPVSVELPELDEATLQRLSHDGDIEHDTIYLYNDGSVPTMGPEYMEAYLKRLEILLRLHLPTAAARKS